MSSKTNRWISSNKKPWLVFDTLAVGLLLVQSFNLLGIFYSAYLSESKTCVVRTNDFGEAKSESVLLPIFFGAGVVALLRVFDRAVRLRA